MTAGSGPDLAETLVVRREAVASLAAEGPITVRDLTQHVDVSRATAHRVLTQLLDHRVVEQTDGGYALTAFGGIAANELETYTSRIEDASTIRPLFDSLVDAPAEFDLAWFADATITRATRADPYGPIERFHALTAEASTERVLNDGLVAPREIVEGADDRLDDGISHTMILSEDTLALYRERHPAIVEQSFARENTTTLVADEIPLDLTLFDERLVLPRVDHETGAVSLLIDTDDPDAMAWGVAVFETCRDSARPVGES